MQTATGADTRLDRTIATLTERLLAARHPAGHWEGRLASSALSTATAVIALDLARRAGDRDRHALVAGGLEWLVATQNADGGWGDTVRSRSNLSTTLLVWAALSLCRRSHRRLEPALARVGHFLDSAVGETTPERLRDAIIRRYGKDRTFSVPILSVLAMTGRLGEGRSAWRLVPQLPFELAACPHRWFQWLRLPVVSYALPALIAIGQVRHHHAPTRNPLLKAVRRGVALSTRNSLADMQPDSGGYLEATPLTSFVVMSLVSAGHVRHTVAQRGLDFLEWSARDDGSWPIDTNLATWLTTLSVNAWGGGAWPDGLEREHLLQWLLAQQLRVEHPFTRAAPGGWAWTDLSGGVPDADDTAGALLALAALAREAPHVREAAEMGIGWLIDLQNRDGGIPTFCRGWGALPFDRSAPDLTAHALQAWEAWHDLLRPPLRARVARATRRALSYLVRAQRPDGSWRPLWFGNEHAADEANPGYGTSRVIAALARVRGRTAAATRAHQRGVEWLVAAQNDDGGWGGDRGTPSSIEETGVALQALARAAHEAPSSELHATIARAAAWIAEVTAEGRETPAAPIGLYFARLWYFEELYPLIFALAGLEDVRRLRPVG